jgi:hypothetical protein
MKNRYVGLLIFLTLDLALGACKKELNVFPTTSEVDGNLITDQQSAQVVLNGVYYRFANVGRGIDNDQSILWTDVNEIFPSELAGSLSLAYGSSAGAGSPAPRTHFDDYFIDAIWKYNYALVNAANGFTRNAVPVATIPAAAKQQMLAEAAFLRAFGNSELLLYYAQYYDPSSKYGIILRDTFVTTENIHLPRSGVAAAYTSILADLDKAIKGLPTLNTAIWYANMWDAKLLKARVLINRGASDDYAQVISLTKDIISNGPFGLEDSLKDIFLSKGFGSKEVMLGIQPYPNENYKFTINQVYRQYVLTDSLVSLLADDSRNQWVYKIVHTPAGFFNALTKYYSGDPDNIAQTPLSTYCYAFRLTEAYLLEAEAITLSNGDLASARSLLTTVMSHAGAGARELDAVAAATTPGSLQLEIIKEYLRNFAFENGVDWLSLRRLPFATLQRLNPNIKDARRLILPIPASELTYNNVIQNPGY